MDAGIAHIVRAVNFVPGVDVVDGMANRRMDENSLRATLWFSLLRFSGREPRVRFELVVSSLMSSIGEKDLLNLNPYLAESDARKISSLTVDVLLHAVRLGQIRRSIAEARSLYPII